MQNLADQPASCPRSGRGIVCTLSIVIQINIYISCFSCLVASEVVTTDYGFYLLILPQENYEYDTSFAKLLNAGVTTAPISRSHSLMLEQSSLFFEHVSLRIWGVTIAALLGDRKTSPSETGLSVAKRHARTGNGLLNVRY